MGFPGGSAVKNLPATQETQVWSLGQEDPLEKCRGTHSSILAWRLPGAKEPGRLQFTRSQSQTLLEQLRTHTHAVCSYRHSRCFLFTPTSEKNWNTMCLHLNRTPVYVCCLAPWYLSLLKYCHHYVRGNFDLMSINRNVIHCFSNMRIISLWGQNQSAVDWLRIVNQTI